MSLSIASRKPLVDKLYDACMEQSGGGSLEINPKRLPGPKSKAAYAEARRDHDSAEADCFRFGGQKWFDVVANAEDAFQIHKFYSKNDKFAGEKEIDF